MIGYKETVKSVASLFKIESFIISELHAEETAATTMRR